MWEERLARPALGVEDLLRTSFMGSSRSETDVRCEPARVAVE